MAFFTMAMSLWKTQPLTQLNPAPRHQTILLPRLRRRKPRLEVPPLLKRLWIQNLIRLSQRRLGPELYHVNEAGHFIGRISEAQPDPANPGGYLVPPGTTLKSPPLCCRGWVPVWFAPYWDIECEELARMADPDFFL